MPHGCDREKMSFCAKLNFYTDDDGGSIGYFIHPRGKKERFYLMLELCLVWAKNASVDSLNKLAEILCPAPQSSPVPDTHIIPV